MSEIKLTPEEAEELKQAGRFVLMTGGSKEVRKDCPIGFVLEETLLFVASVNQMLEVPKTLLKLPRLKRRVVTSCRQSIFKGQSTS